MKVAMGKWNLEFGILKRKMPLSLSNTIGFAQFPFLKGEKYLTFLYFSDKKRIFWVLGGDAKNDNFTKKNQLAETFF